MEYAKVWIKEAERELEAAKVLFEKGLYEMCVYHAQQTAEKSLKSVLILLGKEVYEHRVTSIFRDEVLIKYDYPYLEEIVNKAFWLEQHWLKSRYPLKKVNGKIDVPYQIYTKDVAKKALEYAEFVLEKIKEFLREEFLLDV